MPQSGCQCAQEKEESGLIQCYKSPESHPNWPALPTWNVLPANTTLKAESPEFPPPLQHTLLPTGLLQDTVLWCGGNQWANIRICTNPSFLSVSTFSQSVPTLVLQLDCGTGQVPRATTGGDIWLWSPQNRPQITEPTEPGAWRYTGYTDCKSLLLSRISDE